MSNAVLAFLIALPAGVWVYTRLIRRTGGNTQSSVTASIIAGILIYVLVLILISLIPGN